MLRHHVTKTLGISLILLASVGIEDTRFSARSYDGMVSEHPSHSDSTSMIQARSRITTRSENDTDQSSRKNLDWLSLTWEAASNHSTELLDADLLAEIGYWRPSHWIGTKRCASFESSIMSNGMPVCVQAFMFGLIATASIPLGAFLGVFFAPMDGSIIAQCLALGAGALVFAVATQLYGDHLAGVMHISRGADGCFGTGDRNICYAKFFDLVEMMVSGLVGAWIYVRVTKWLENMLAAEHLHAVDFTTEDLIADAKEFAAKEGGKSNVALAMWCGMLLDSVPEALMLGLMTNQHKLKFGFLFAIFLSNFPEAFSGAGILKEHNWSQIRVVGIWALVFILTGIIAMIGSLMMPDQCGPSSSLTLSHVAAIVQGVSGGMMLAMMATAMLPESYRRYGSSSGLFFVLGFVISVAIQTAETYLATPQELLHRVFPRHW